MTKKLFQVNSSTWEAEIQVLSSQKFNLQYPNMQPTLAYTTSTQNSTLQPPSARNESIASIKYKKMAFGY